MSIIPQRNWYQLVFPLCVPSTHTTTNPYPEPQETCNLLLDSIDLPILDFSYKWNYTIYSFLWIDFFSLSIRFPKFIYVVVSVLHSFLWTIFYFLDIIQIFIHLTVDGHLGCFHLGVIMNNAAMNIHVQVIVWMYFFLSLGYIARSRIAGSNGNSMFHNLKTCHTIFQSNCPISHSHQQWMRVPVCPYPSQQLLLSIFWK